MKSRSCISNFGLAKSSKHVISLTKDSLPIRNYLCLIDKAGRDQLSVTELPSARFKNLRKRQNQILQHVGEGVVLDCRRQHFIKGGRAYVVLATSPLFVSLGQYSKAAFYYFFELRARNYWRCHFWKKKMN